MLTILLVVIIVVVIVSILQWKKHYRCEIGAGPTVVRAMSLNMGMLASYDQSVELFRDKFGAGEVSTVIGKILLFGFFIFFVLSL